MRSTDTGTTAARMEAMRAAEQIEAGHRTYETIREAGFRPVERDTLYRAVVRERNRWRVAPAGR